MTGWQPHCLDLFCHTLQKEVAGHLRKILFSLTKPRKKLICCRKWQRCEFQCRWVGLPRWLHSSKPWSVNDMIEIHGQKIKGVKKRQCTCQTRRAGTILWWLISGQVRAPCKIHNKTYWWSSNGWWNGGVTSQMLHRGWKWQPQSLMTSLELVAK